MIYEFDKAIPIPTSVERVGVNIELLRAMQPGESQWWSEADAKKAARFYRVAKKLGVPIVIRKVGKTDPRGAGVRMWRREGGPAVVPMDPLVAAAEAAARKAKKPAAKKPAAKKAIKTKRAAGTNSGLEPAPHKVLKTKAKRVRKAAATQA
jgi:hypothetical protein